MRAFRRALLPLALALLGVSGCSCGTASPSVPPTPVTPTFNATRAFGFLTAQCDFGPRTPGSDAHEQCTEYLIQQLQGLADSVTVQAFDDPLYSETEVFHLSNIIARFGTGDGGLLLGAHWDCRPWADRDPEAGNRDEPILGASDGASGVAVLLELANLFHEAPPPMPVTIVLFDAEDCGRTVEEFCVGSRYFATHLQGDQPAHAIVVDLVGGASLRLPKESKSVQADPVLVDVIWDTASRLGIGQFEQRVRGPVFDDHVPLIEAGIPSVDIIDLDYEYWHTLGDTPEHCSAESLKAVGDVLVHVIYEELAQ